MRLRLGRVEEERGAPRGPRPQEGLGAPGLGRRDRVGAPHVDGPVQGEAKDQRQDGFGSPLLQPRRPAGAVGHAEPEAAAPACHAAGLQRSRQLGRRADGEIGNSAGWRLH